MQIPLISDFFLNLIVESQLERNFYWILKRRLLFLYGKFYKYRNEILKVHRQLCKEGIRGTPDEPFLRPLNTTRSGALPPLSTSSLQLLSVFT